MIDDVKAPLQSTLQNLAGKARSETLNSPTQGAGGNSATADASLQQEVSITDTAAKLRQLEAQIANQPVVDSQRVESVKKAIADGSFRIDSNRIAEKMADFESLLASKSEKE